MKLKCFVVCILICICTLFTACNGSGNIDYDLSVTGFQFRYEMVTNMKNTPKEYEDKTIKLKGNLRSNGGSYQYLTETDNICCEWKLEVQLENDNLVFPTDKKDDIMVIGKFSTYKKNDVVKPYLKITDFVEET